MYRDRRDIHHDLNANLYAIVKLPFGFEYQMNFTPRYHWYEYMNHESAEHPEWAGDGGRSERKNEKHLIGRLIIFFVGRKNSVKIIELKPLFAECRKRSMVENRSPE